VIVNKDEKRLDVVLVDRELVSSRSRAKAMIMAGVVYVDGKKVDKAGSPTPDKATIEVRGEQNPYVSRGGLKLEAALKAFEFHCDGLSVLDIGASTGGFTDCVLQHGARKVSAIDVGYGQLAWRLRNDPRVHCLERTNIRTVSEDQLPGRFDLIVIDCSFISLGTVLPCALRFLEPGGQLIALIKPQFEVGRKNLGKGGVVRDEKMRSQAIEAVVSQANDLGLARRNSIDSPVHGPKGNVEHLVLFDWTPQEQRE
jgi:23S rRNA (cytidine1920-2'-O)/16S rRNA (cytidine1409-2'-O)-methyltransferase